MTWMIVSFTTLVDTMEITKDTTMSQLLRPRNITPVPLGTTSMANAVFEISRVTHASRDGCITPSLGNASVRAALPVLPLQIAKLRGRNAKQICPSAGRKTVFFPTRSKMPNRSSPHVSARGTNVGNSHRCRVSLGNMSLIPPVRRKKGTQFTSFVTNAGNRKIQMQFCPERRRRAMQRKIKDLAGHGDAFLPIFLLE